MPTYLLNRRRPDSIREFRAAASERFEDGEKASAANRRTAAIYLWGYAAEMTLKAAYFAVLGYPPARPISIGDLEAARNSGITAFGMTWPGPGKFHNIRAWADLLVEHRSRTPGGNYAHPGFGEEVRTRGRRIEPIWSETLRYHKNTAYLHEVERMREAAGWLLLNSPDL